MASEKSPTPEKTGMEDDQKVCSCCCPQRWRLAVISFFGFIFVYALRVNMSVAIVCMVKEDNSTSNTTDNSTKSCGSDSSSSSDNEGEFDWDKSVRSNILSSFFYGYLVLQIPSGWMASRFGGKKVMGTGMGIVATATVLLPVLARQDYRFVYALRVIAGLGSSVSFPSMHTMWGKWAPPAERSRLTSLTYAGVTVGNIVAFIFSGYLCAYGFDNGWGSVFYLTGGGCYLWLAAWWLLVSDSPDKCPGISKAERDYIITSIGNNPDVKFSIPWKSILRSRALWVCVVAHFCNNWMHYTLLTSLPTFMNEVLHYNIKENGLLSSVPFMVKVVTALVTGFVVDYLRAHYISTRTARRSSQAISFLGATACMIGLGFVDCEQRVIAVVLLSIAVGFEGLCYSGYAINHIDFASKYAGLLLSITNCVATVPGIVAPLVAGALTPNVAMPALINITLSFLVIKKTQEEWRNVFYVTSAFTLLGAIVFGGFAKTETEPWAKDPEVNVMNTEFEVEVDSKDKAVEKNTYENKAMDNTDMEYYDTVDTRL